MDGGGTIWELAHGRSLLLGSQARVMGIVNVTPDSFSDGGLHDDVSRAVAHALKLSGDGADILDIGGESTRPDAAETDAATEQARVLPVIAALAAHPSGPLISVDTYRADTARKAIAAGAHIINDVHGLQREPDIARVAAGTNAGLCIMHTGRGRERLDDPVADQFAFFERSLEIAQAAGVRRGQIVLDPGFGFAKDIEINLALMARFDELLALGYPLLAGTSRKRFLGTLTGREPHERDVATAATSVLLRRAGASVFRVHDVAVNRDALAVSDAMTAAEQGRQRQ